MNRLRFHRVRRLLQMHLFLFLLTAVSAVADPILPAEWPLVFDLTGSPVITSEFGPRILGDHYNFHVGVDFIGNGYGYYGDVVYSVSDGEVLEIQDQGVNGEVSIVWHYVLGYYDEYVGIYGHLYNVLWYNEVGDPVYSGGSTIGNTYDLASGPHLHYAASFEPPDAFPISVPNWHPAATLPIDDQTCSELTNVTPTVIDGYI